MSSIHRFPLFHAAFLSLLFWVAPRPASASDHVVLAEILGKAGIGSVGYEWSPTDRLTLGVGLGMAAWGNEVLLSYPSSSYQIRDFALPLYAAGRLGNGRNFIALAGVSTVAETRFETDRFASISTPHISPLPFVGVGWDFHAGDWVIRPTGYVTFGFWYANMEQYQPWAGLTIGRRVSHGSQDK